MLQLFELHIQSWPELCHFLLQFDYLPLPRAHIGAQLGDAGVTPEIIGGDEGGDGGKTLDECSWIEGWIQGVLQQEDEQKLESTGGNICEGHTEMLTLKCYEYVCIL